MIGVEIRPWTLVERIVCWLVMDGDRTVATLQKPYGEENRAAAEAKLIGAAPKLADILEKLASRTIQYVGEFAEVEGLECDEEMRALAKEGLALLAQARGARG